MTNGTKPKFEVVLNICNLSHSLAYWEQNLPKIRAEIENQHHVVADYSIKSLVVPEAVILGTNLNLGEKKDNQIYEDVYAKVKAVVARYNV